MSSLNEDIISFVKNWNVMYPIDHWWRRKHKVPFNSKMHKDQCILDMRIEYEEDKMFNEYLKEPDEKEEKEEKYIPGYGSIFKKRKPIQVSENEAEDMFDKLDISALKEGDDGSITL